MRPLFASPCLHFVAFLCIPCWGSILRAKTFLGHAVDGQGLHAAKSHDQRKLPELCADCQSGLISPLLDESQYCTKLYNQCECCKEKVQRKIQDICSQFLGYGGCVSGIQAKMKEKQDECKQKQAIEDYNHKSKMEKIQKELDKIGADVDLTPDFLAHNRSAARGPYDTDCESYSDPSCSSQKALCGFDAGCNRQLQQATWNFEHINGYYEMLQNLYC
eukprot:TRINITY_DN75276_c0_g1_i1.p1 TRINITY_DN75276_c0_g1~~TRINITY_DN75276_c0_g1_i1.p1  ORF type:complete len:218 (-),score=31.52 TRINITY_DN75276_c0_g1_i1:66-719(-)